MLLDSGVIWAEPVPGRLFYPAQPDLPLRRTGVGAAPRPCWDPVRDGSAGRAPARPMRSAPRSGPIVWRQGPARRGTTTKLTTVTNVSVDGAMQGLGGPDEDPKGGFERGGWALPLVENDIEARGIPQLGLPARRRVPVRPADLRDLRQLPPCDRDAGAAVRVSRHPEATSMELDRDS